MDKMGLASETSKCIETVSPNRIMMHCLQLYTRVLFALELFVRQLLFFCIALNSSELGRKRSYLQAKEKNGKKKKIESERKREKESEREREREKEKGLICNQREKCEKEKWNVTGLLENV